MKVKNEELISLLLSEIYLASDNDIRSMFLCLSKMKYSKETMDFNKSIALIGRKSFLLFSDIKKITRLKNNDILSALLDNYEKLL